MAGIKFEQVWKRFAEVTVLKDLNIDIGDGEFLVLVGPSGCGKSTALRCLAGLEEISEGNIWIGDRVVNDVPPKDRDIAMVFQSYALYPHMSVYDNMAFGLKLRKVARQEIEQRVKEAAEMLSIGHLLDRKPKALSGGQRQRVALGRAIVRDPSVFLMDEPLSNLDAKLRVQTRAEISKLHQRLKTTFIYVTHDQTEALTMGTRIAVMRDGILQQLDTPQNLYDQPQNMFVAGFIGSPAMNFFEAKLEQANGGLAVVVGNEFVVPVPKSKATKIGSHIGKSVSFGIRPEDIHDADYIPRGVDENARLTTMVNVIEPMGSEVYAYIESSGKEFIGRLDPRTSARTGQHVEIVLNMDKMHLFDRETEKALV
ncbi:ABC transporter ATP-binding protein [Candidatus Viridilinea mediisalina]|uniref:Glycerol-3-phosphate ABC transporter ATP-binding protein n=1 Tax=Candidatus Viridilinea mediisalina TaxID=2024553 RepID=A0A2A6RE48_9CHLR|nr:ABC transporter ATP-binding protein [Candidatus Viridilinea mediisalina]PDW00645.1 glycerol-3-phosphate ABC transporter ATP-binding protein [Candidatus Viridilinea mediisalina]